MGGTQRLAVDVPAGSVEGDVLTVEAAGRAFVVEVPAGFGVGSTFEVDLPCEEDESMAAGSFEIVVPEGVAV
eukprot:3126334-Prymnesium_polylepis.1